MAKNWQSWQQVQGRNLETGLADFRTSMNAITPGITQEDIGLVQQGVGASTDIAMRELQRILPQILGQASGQAGTRGLGGSGIEGIARGMGTERAVGSMADMLSNQQRMGAEYLMQVPWKRAEFQAGRNQALFNALIGTVTPQAEWQMEEGRQKAAEKAAWGQAIGGSFGMAGDIASAFIAS